MYNIPLTQQTDSDDDALSDGEWEDEPGSGVLDLGLPGMKEHLMGLGGAGEEGEFRVRQADDETQGYVIFSFFLSVFCSRCVLGVHRPAVCDSRFTCDGSVLELELEL